MNTLPIHACQLVHTMLTHVHSLTTNFAKAEEKIVSLEQQMDQFHEESSNLQRELDEKTSQLNQMSDSHDGEDSETDLRSTVHLLRNR